MPISKIKAGDFVRDIKAGTAFSALLKKHGLTFKEFHVLTTRLLDAGVVHIRELVGRYPLMEPETGSGCLLFEGTARRFLRTVVEFPLLIHEEDQPGMLAKIHDISVQGLRINGLKASKDEIKSLVIPLPECFSIHAVRFEAVCRWARTEQRDGMHVCGFEAVRFRQGSLRDLHSWLFSPRG